MTLANLKRFKRFLNYCISTLIILILSLILLISYEFYIKINRDSGQSNVGSVNKDTQNDKSENHDYAGVERLNHVKVGYKEHNNDPPHIFIIDVLKVGKCKYILVHSHINNYTDIELVHANDCDECQINDKNYHEISKELLELLNKEKLKN